jgi:1-acyl-sn-glycerol-3-phosphate acyltransferase
VFENPADLPSEPPLSGGEIEAAARENKRLTFPVRESNKSRLAGKLRYWWCWFAAGAMLLVIAAPALIVLWIINRRTWLYPIANWGAKTWLRACGAEVAVSGTELLNERTSYVFVSNHRSYLDTAALFRYSGRRMGLVAKKELLKVPVLGQGMSFVNIIAIDRSDPERALRSMEKARQVMDKGYSFGVFAEGTRAMPGELLPFKKGAFHLALQTGAPIVPVAILNTDNMMGKGTGVAFPGVIEMVFGEPIETAGMSERDIPDLIAAGREFIARQLTARSPQRNT